MRVRQRLSYSQLRTLLNIARRCLIPAAAPVHAPTAHGSELWRRGLVHVWYRQSQHNSPSLSGPFFTPTFDGWKVAGKCGLVPPGARSA